MIWTYWVLGACVFCILAKANISRFKESYHKIKSGCRLFVNVSRSFESMFLPACGNGKSDAPYRRRVFCLTQIPALHVTPPCESMFAQSVKRTKTFHVKQFCPILRGKSDNIFQ
jgi:hypothetical protein